MADVFWLGKRVIALEHDVVKLEKLGGYISMHKMN